MGQYDDPITAADPDIRTQKTEAAQWLLAGNNRYGIKTYTGRLDGIPGPRTLKAAGDMKWRIGYAAGNCHPTFGQDLYRYLLPKRNRLAKFRSAVMVARAKARIPRPVRTWSYPAAIRGRVIGYPYQGTHRRGNWQSDRGFDIALPPGTAILSPWPGVIGSKWGDLGKGGVLYGKRIYVIRADGNQMYLAHNATLIARPGQRVAAGDIIAKSNFPGIPHLHATVMRGDPYREILGYGRPRALFSRFTSGEPDTIHGMSPVVMDEDLEGEGS